MREETFCEILGEIDDRHIVDAKQKHKAKRTVWFKWGTMAACLCLVILGATLWHSIDPVRKPQEDEPVSAGGMWPEGVDPIVASLAVSPTGVDLRDVADATLIDISEEDAQAVENLGAYIPETLPEGICFGNAGYYETIMKNGTRYHMIRVTYASKNEGSTSAMNSDTALLWMVWGHLPDESLPIYQPEKVSAQIIDQHGGGVFYINYDGIYVGISQMDIETEQLLAMIKSLE
ncbi:MAG: hypothetical protein E7449_02015 [Ruminococcaceae bacterium]|nr:hypothetical protein [Oscillospiraceae bacterium]